MNLGLNTQKLHNLVILGSHVPVHLGPVPVHVAFCWHVPVHVRPVPVHVGLWWGVLVHPCTCTGTCSENCPDLLLLPLLIPIILILLPHYLIPQKSSWKSSKTTSKYLYWWFGTSYHKTLGKNPMNSPKGPSILQNII